MTVVGETPPAHVAEVLPGKGDLNGRDEIALYAAEYFIQGDVAGIVGELAYVFRGDLLAEQAGGKLALPRDVIFPGFAKQIRGLGRGQAEDESLQRQRRTWVNGVELIGGFIAARAEIGHPLKGVNIAVNIA